MYIGARTARDTMSAINELAAWIKRGNIEPSMYMPRSNDPVKQKLFYEGKSATLWGRHSTNPKFKALVAAAQSEDASLLLPTDAVMAAMKHTVVVVPTVQTSVTNVRQMRTA
jgi:hypothetical protein